MDFDCNPLSVVEVRNVYIAMFCEIYLPKKHKHVVQVQSNLDSEGVSSKSLFVGVAIKHT